MTELEQLTKKIQKHNKELTELSFGCRIQSDNKNGKTYTFLSKDSTSEIPKLKLLNEEGKVVELNMWHFGYFTLGHPITLEHVLKAVNALDKKGEEERQSKWKGSNPPFWSVNTYGVFMQIQYPGTKAEGIYYADHKWTLTKPLHEQSPELIKWLLTIIT